MKSYTDLKQSKTLEKILPLESADLYYDISFDNEYHINMPTNGYFGNKRFFIQFPEAVPCWSLVALLNVFPNSEQKSVDICHGGWKGEEYVSDWFCSYDDYKKNYFETTNSDNPVDACVEMIIKLKENKLL